MWDSIWQHGSVTGTRDKEAWSYAASMPEVMQSAAVTGPRHMQQILRQCRCACPPCTRFPATLVWLPPLHACPALCVPTLGKMPSYHSWQVGSLSRSLSFTRPRVLDSSWGQEWAGGGGEVNGVGGGGLRRTGRGRSWPCHNQCSKTLLPRSTYSALRPPTVQSHRLIVGSYVPLAAPQKLMACFIPASFIPPPAVRVHLEQVLDEDT